MAKRENINYAIEYYISTINLRKKELFSDFFVQGYHCTELSSVDEKHKDDTFHAKMYLGMLITLIDDLADNPRCFNPKLLDLIYKNTKNNNKLSLEDLKILKLKNFLLENMCRRIKNLPNYTELINIFNFDLEKIYLSNKFSELLTSRNFISNSYEMKLYGSYTMGVLAAGMIDLMGVGNLNYSEVGMCREIFIRGQRLAKIANNIATFEREISEGDVTNEMRYEIEQNSRDLNYCKNKLEKEFVAGVKLIKTCQNNTKNFDVSSYAHGIEKLFELNMFFIEKI